MKPKPRLTLLSLLGILLALMMSTAGCTSTSSSRAPGTKEYAPTDVARVQLVPWAPTRPHERIGEVIVEPHPGASWQEIDQELREAAADLGAHAIYIVWDPGKRFSSVQVDPVSSDRRDHYPPNSIVAVAIRFI